jgi:hypothetical protein
MFSLMRTVRSAKAITLQTTHPMKRTLLLIAVTLLVSTLILSRADDGDEPSFPYSYSEISELASTNMAWAPSAAPLPYITSTTFPTAAPTLNFLALGDDGNRRVADLSGAVGPSNVMTMLNSQVRIQDRSGATNFTDTLNHWWNSHGVSGRAGDPRIVYDPYADRWIACAFLDSTVNRTNAGIGLAVSPNGDPASTNWLFLKLFTDPASHNQVPDFPMIGFNKRWIVVSANLFSWDLSLYYYPRLYFFDRTNLYAGNTNCVVRNLDPTYETVVPAKTYDSTIDDLYFLMSQKVTGQADGVRRFKASPSGTNIVWSEIFPTAVGPKWAAKANCGWTCDFAPQTNSTVRISNNDHRIQSVIYRNGFLWATHTIFLPATNATHSAIQWWRINATNTGSSAVIERGILDGFKAPNYHYYAFPSLAVNKFNEAFIGFSTFSSNMFPSASYVFPPVTTDSPFSYYTPYTYKAGQDVYWRTNNGVNRWGDYSSTQVDPSNDTDFWTLQEYAAPNATGSPLGARGRFGAWWAKLALSVPANDMFANPIELSGGSVSTNLKFWRSTAEAGEPAHAGKEAFASIWCTWTAPTTGPVLLSTPEYWGFLNATAMKVSMAVYTGSALTNLSVVSSNTGTAWGVPILKHSMYFTATSNTTYHIALDRCPLSSTTFVIDQPAAPIFTDDLEPEIHILASNVLTVASVAIGNPTPTYQWRTNGVAKSGATYATHTNLNVQFFDAGAYDVIASNSYGSATSSIANVFVYNSAAATLTDWKYDATNNLILTLTGATTYPYQIQASTDFTNWTSLVTNYASFNFTNAPSTNYPYRFFRGVYSP